MPDHRVLFLGGQFVPAQEGRLRSILNPATGQVLAEVAEAGEADVDLAVQHARTAYQGVWRTLGGAQRASFLLKIAGLIQQRARDLARLETLNVGKPIRASYDFDVPHAAACFSYSAGFADKLELAFPGLTPTPLGVVAQVIPSNFPLLLAAGRIAPALACGNTVVLKPAETTPLTALVLAEICQDAGLPPGVVNIVTGDGATGTALVRHAGVDKVAFTGSSAVGKEIRRVLAGRGKPFRPSPAGKDVHLVFEDAALDQAVEGLVRATFTQKGPDGCAGSLLLVQEGIHDVFLAKLLRRIERIRVGDPMDRNTDMGVVHAAQLARIEELVSAAVGEGAVLHAPASPLPERGSWYRPSLLTGVRADDRVVVEDMPGPVLCVMTFRTPDEAISMANQTRFRMSVGIWTHNTARALFAAKRLRAGVVWINTSSRFDPASPCGFDSGKNGLLSNLHLSPALRPG